MQSLDSELLLLINGCHNTFWDTFMYAFSGKVIWVPLYVALAFMLIYNLMPRRKASGSLRSMGHTGSWRLVIFALIGVALTIVFADQICSHVIRPWAMRLRPSSLENPLSEHVHIVNGYRGAPFGFPSCHAANTFGLAFYFLLLFRQKGLSLTLMCWALVTCYSRAYLGVHYPGDLLVGALIGMTGAGIMYLLMARLTGYRRPQRPRFAAIPMIVFALTVIGIISTYLLG